MYRLITLLGVILLSTQLYGQGRNDFFYYDSLTFSQYNNSDWKRLSGSGNEALHLGHDYYYMRMRIGISYYERGNYLRAMVHFRKALEFNEGDQTAMEYLYYCNVFLARWGQATALSRNFGNTLSERTGVTGIDRNRISADFLINDSDSESIIDEYLSLNGLPDPGNRVIPKSLYNIGLTMDHLVDRGVGIYHTISYLYRSNSLFSNDGSGAYPDFNQDVRQIQYFFSVPISSQSGIDFTPSIYYINSKYTLLTFSTSGMQPAAYSYFVKEHNIGSGFLLTKRFTVLDLSINTYLSKIGSRNHLQAGGDIVIYPAGNNNLYIGGGYNIIRSEIVDGHDISFIAEGKIGFNIGKRINLELAGISGGIENFVDKGGQIVYNGINEVHRVLKADLSLSLGKSGFIIYLGSRHISESTAYIPIDYTYSVSSDNRFNSLSFIGGLSWTY